MLWFNIIIFLCLFWLQHNILFRGFFFHWFDVRSSSSLAVVFSFHVIFDDINFLLLTESKRKFPDSETILTETTRKFIWARTLPWIFLLDCYNARLDLKTATINYMRRRCLRIPLTHFHTWKIYFLNTLKLPKILLS